MLESLNMSLKELTFYSSIALYALAAIYALGIFLPFLSGKQMGGTDANGADILSLADIAEWSERSDVYEDSPGHSQRVADLACEMGRSYGLSEPELESLKMAALLHDVGQLDRYDFIQQGRMIRQEERLQLEDHPLLGEEFVLSRWGQEYGPAAQLVRWHHERWDGLGYPDRLSGEHIPLSARILAIADAYDAMSHDRPYRPALSPEKSLQELQRYAGIMFDPQLVQMIANHLSQGAGSGLKLEI